MDGKISQILQEFVTQSLGIKGVVLVTSQGQPLTLPIGIADDSSSIIAGMMLYLAERIGEECNWHEIKRISLQAEEGYITLISCSEEIFLLITTANQPSSFLDEDIIKTVRKLQITLNLKGSADLTLLEDDSSIQETYTTTGTKIKKLEPHFISLCQQELIEFVGPMAPIICQRILNKNPELLKIEFVKLLARQIPDSKESLEFQRRLLG